MLLISRKIMSPMYLSTMFSILSVSRLIFSCSHNFQALHVRIQGMCPTQYVFTSPLEFSYSLDVHLDTHWIHLPTLSSCFAKRLMGKLNGLVLHQFVNVGFHFFQLYFSCIFLFLYCSTFVELMNLAQQIKEL